MVWWITNSTCQLLVAVPHFENSSFAVIGRALAILCQLFVIVFPGSRGSPNGSENRRAAPPLAPISLLEV
jgi:hypothetical protein